LFEENSVNEAIAKAATLIEALAYIQQYHGRLVVVKIGGSVMDNAQAMHELLHDVVFMRSVGIQPVVVHGGGKAITQAMDEAGLEAHFVQGLRYTDERTLAIAEHVLCNVINTDIVETLKAHGVDAIGLHSLSSCVVFGERTYLDGEGGRRIDVGFVGRVTDVNAKVITLLCAAETIPVIAPIARDNAGGKLNVNADVAAGEVAASVKSEKLVMLSDTQGILNDPRDPKSFCPALDRRQINRMMAEGVISKGMIPKVQSCLRALDAGVRKAHVIDGRIPHSILLEIFTKEGVGTEIVQ
jgi:acetylglutamate kinase